MAELLLDSAIRIWVFLPLVIITFLFGVIRHYLTILFTSEKKADLQQVSDTHVLMRSRMLRENGRFLPKQAFNARKVYLMHFFENENREGNVKSPMTDPSMLSDMLKGNVLNMIPMLVIGGWINWAFTGFLCTKIPFPLTYRFKPMLQRGCESLVSLDASWVSSASWYFLNIFGLRSMYTLVLGQDNAADQARVMQDQMTGGMNAAAMAAASGPQDFQKAFKAEREALEMEDHKWALEGVEERLIR